MGREYTPQVDIEVILSSDNRGWVIEKFAYKLVEFASDVGYQIKILEKPSGNSKVIHWMHYLNVDLSEFSENSVNTVLVTHVDESWKFTRLKKLIEIGFYPIYLSFEQARFVEHRLGRSNNSFYVRPGTDVSGSFVGTEMVTISIASHVYPDGRKNEKFLWKLAKGRDFSSYHFILIGKRWERTAEILKKSNATVSHYSKDQGNYPSYESINAIIQSSDLFLYLGFDEGSLGALDAYLLGTKLLVSNQGFHREFIVDPINLFDDYSMFQKHFNQITDNILKYKSDKNSWGWKSFANSHVKIWDYLNGGGNVPSEKLDQSVTIPSPPHKLSKWDSNFASARTFVLEMQRKLKR